ncbi:ras-related protein Rab-38-like [Poeciliopsis prolifica]|uniref:ras-related protein Rab-38-like n=1 Tax=Poeciliopsis prolifica TaxID=188132 RepID=UPI0024133D5C|nr:ras-related protein Rab-38-like [Poeciliopsis prolifica]
MAAGHSTTTNSSGSITHKHLFLALISTSTVTTPITAQRQTIKMLHSCTGGTEWHMQQELLFKVLVVGDLGVGKTSIIKRYVHQIFSQHYRATIGVDFALKVLQWDSDTVIRLQLWDIAGQERYGNMTRVYYREAVGALVVFDVTRASTFEAVLKWKDDLDSKVTLNHGRPVPAVLLANKSDQMACQLPKLDFFCRENGFVGWFETSAKENTNIEEAARCLVEHIMNNEEISVTEREPTSILLSGYASTARSPLNCSSCLK